MTPASACENLLTAISLLNAAWCAAGVIYWPSSPTPSNPGYCHAERDALEFLSFALPEPETDAEAGYDHWRQRVAGYSALPDTTHDDILELYDRAVSVAERKLAFLAGVG